MIYCPKCGSIILPTKGKSIAVCSCGYRSKEKLESLKEKVNTPTYTVEVVKKEIETLPSTEIECPKCEHGKAFYWTLQTRAGDEGETKFLKCAKCKHVWRDYG